MTRRLLSTLRARVRNLLPSPAQLADRAAAEPACDVLRQPLVADRAPDAGGTHFGAMFQAEPHRSEWTPAQLDAEIRARAGAVMGTQPDYQPLYGFGDEFRARRTPHLERNVEIVHTVLKHLVPKHQPRILDVGCNLGYVAMRIAETYPNVVGVEISRDHLELCRLLAARAGSLARFFGDDALAMFADPDDDLEAVDVVLLYNVVHQFIFHRGFEATKALLGKLASRVDTVIVELALRQDYVRHGKDHLLPENPADVLAECSDAEITKLVDTPRPVYRIRRRVVRHGDVEIVPKRIEYSLNPNPLVSRKYYLSDDRFMKLLRFTCPGDRDTFDREVAALGKLSGSEVAPLLIGASASAHSGAVLMSRVVGDRLVTRLYPPSPPLPAGERMHITREYLRVTKAVHDRIGYQNDTQAHNLICTKDKRLVLVDYEQAGPEPTNDPFGMLLWSVFDIWGGRDKERPAAIRTLRLTDAETPRVYPRFDGLGLPPVVHSLVQAAATGGDWSAFLASWSTRLAADATAPQ